MSPHPPDLHLPRRVPTIADVAMRVALDGPLYAVIALVGGLALSGRASALEMIAGSLAALLARTLPPGPRNAAAGAGVALLLAQAAFGAP